MPRRVAAGLTIVLLAHTFQFGEAAPGDVRPVLAAPQASIMKALVVGFMSRQPVTYLLFGVGALITLVLEMLGKSSLVFALGIYLPLGLTTPILTGGFLSHFVQRRSEKTGGEPGQAHSRARRHSGFRASWRAARSAAFWARRCGSSRHFAKISFKTPFYCESIPFRNPSPRCCLSAFAFMSGAVHSKEEKSHESARTCMLLTLCSASTPSGAATSCARQARGASSPTHGSLTSLASAYTHPAGDALRKTGGVCAKSIDRDAVETYLREVDLPAAIAGVRKEADALRRTAPLVSLADLRFLLK